MQAVLIAIVAFVVMEPLTYAAHRWLMHGPGDRLHRSHHRSRRIGRVEANDWFPVGFAIVVMTVMTIGFNVPGWSVLVPVTVGVTAYGAAYALVHDGYIHGRLPVGHRRFATLDRLAEAHRVHHLFNGEPYGMLLPIVPTDLRRRAAATDRPLPR